VVVLGRCCNRISAAATYRTAPGRALQSARPGYGFANPRTEWESSHEGLVSHRSTIHGRDPRDRSGLTASNAAWCRAERQSGAGGHLWAQTSLSKTQTLLRKTQTLLLRCSQLLLRWLRQLRRLLGPAGRRRGWPRLCRRWLPRPARLLSGPLDRVALLNELPLVFLAPPNAGLPLCTRRHEFDDKTEKRSSLPLTEQEKNSSGLARY
jgi:hypothetical protein